MSIKVTFSSDMTFRWRCRESDVLVWLRWKDIFVGGTVQMVDAWKMRDGEEVTITNRMEDLPVWFKLHPTEVSGSLSSKMKDLLDKGYPHPSAPLEGPNIWRPASGDHLVRIAQTGNDPKSEDGIHAILNFDQCALVLGECNGVGTDESIPFGSFSKEGLNPYDLASCKRAVELVKQMGIPRKMRFRWGLGS